MHDWKILLALIIPGAAAALGKIMNGGQKITIRLLLARMILGASTSSVAGVVLIQYPLVPFWALVGIASALGIAGQQAIEAFLQKFMGPAK